ncbi:GNAT family N-acetyltransferase [Halobacillus litoralis]|uniref:GNAT family N-acetyltransferase n=1 Tax=Halobacillus litoralis TaxID=45668 RepID=UPI001CFDD2DF|nr:GNAT family N-acetyltransferase [Halobacillus litoralis]
MTIVYGTDAGAFKKEVEALLLEREAENNLPLGILERMQESNSEECHLIHITENNQPLFMSMRTPPHLWILPSMSTAAKKHIKEFAMYLRNHQYEVPGILGETNVVGWFLSEWEALTKKTAVLQMEQGIHRLDQLQPIKKQRGELVKADVRHASLLKGWMYQYGIETEEGMVCKQAVQITEGLIKDGRIYLWVVDDTPVSMVSRARTTKNGATINAVYTPDQYKRNGYASQAVWHLSALLLEEGFNFCSLYTDLANPTSNSIYKKIGYQQIGESVVYHYG